jgi:hypothetical protein
MSRSRRILVSGLHSVVVASLLLAGLSVPVQASSPATVSGASETADLAEEPAGVQLVEEGVEPPGGEPYEPGLEHDELEDDPVALAHTPYDPGPPPEEWEPPGRANRAAEIPGALLPGATKSAELQGRGAQSMRVDGVARLEFPSGALGRAARVVARRLERLPAEVPANVLYAGYGIDVEIREPGNGRRVGRTNAEVTIVVDYSTFPDVGNVASQLCLKIMHYDEETGEWEILPTVVDTDAKTLTARTDSFSPLITVHNPSTVVGNYAQPSVPSVDINVDLFTGSASYAYPLDLPAGRAGLQPDLTIGYNSGIVDAMRGRLNPQASWVGAGWNLDVGYISRKIQYDANGVPEIVGEYTLVLNGVSSKLVGIGSGQYRTEDERFWRIQRVSGAQSRDGKYWVVTTTDGTQYRFGYTDETAGDSRHSAWWMVATEEGSGTPDQDHLKIVNYRWNLDQVTDTHDNWIRYDYVAEHNNFSFVWPPQRYWDGERWRNDNYLYWEYNPCGGYECDFDWVDEYGNPMRDHLKYMCNTAPIRGGYLSSITYSHPNPAYRIDFVVEERVDYPSKFRREGNSNPVSPQTFWTMWRVKYIDVKTYTGAPATT